MANQRLQPELRRLLDGLCNGRLTEADSAKLDALLQADPAARDAYREWMTIEAELYATHTSDPASVDPQPSPDRLIRPKSRRRIGEWLAVAASLLIAAGISSWATRSAMLARADRAPANRSVVDENASDLSDLIPPAPAVARITATRNCRWSDPKLSVGYGIEVHAGQRLELLSGVSEITFGSGAKLLLEGPATLDVESVQSVELISGQLSASVPLGESSLRVHTPTLGVEGVTVPAAIEGGGSSAPAEFGLIAQAGGAAEVHVFRGDVRALLIDRLGKSLRSVPLAPAEAAKVLPASTTVAKFHANDDRFVRSIYATTGPHDGLYAYEGFDYPPGPLALQNGGFGWGGPWADIESASAFDAPATNRVDQASLTAGGLIAAGNRAVQSAQRNRIRRSLSTSLGGVFDAAGLVENRDGHRLVGKDGTTVYLSFLQRVDQTDDVFYGFELHRGDGNANRVLCLGNGADGAGYGVTSNYNAYGKRNLPALGEENTEVNFLVVKIEFGREDRDLVTVYRNPESLLNESECEADARLKGNFAFDRISLGNFDGVKRHEIDEVRIGVAFRAVTGQRDRSPDVFSGRIARLIPSAKPHGLLALAR